MRVLYLGANLRMRLSNHSAPGFRGLGLKQGLEQAGIQVVQIMAGDHVNSEKAQRIYSNNLKGLLPPYMTRALHDIYEIILDWRFYHAVETQLQDIKPDLILQKHSRYGQVGIKLGQRYHLPVFLDDITPVWEGEQFSDRSLKPIARLIRKKVFSRASGLIAVSHQMEMQLKAEGIPDNKIIFVPNGVDCTLFNPDTTSLDIRRKYGFEKKVVVGYVGGFQSWHRLDLLIQVAMPLINIIPNIHFFLVGTDTDERITTLIRENNLSDRFTIPGGVPHSEVPFYMNAMDITILPSTLNYMSPMKIYEYMAMGKPVVAPRKNSIVETVVVPNQHGLLFEAENADSMINALITLAIDPDLREKMGKESRKTAVDNFSWNHQASTLIQAFHLISQKSTV